MSVSILGVLVCLGLLALGCVLRAPVIIALFGSLPFGSTAIGTLPELGGSSPLIYAVIGILFCASLLVRRGSFRDLGTIFASHWVAWIVAALIMHAAATAWIMPRLFAGQTSALVPVLGGIRELPLAPVSGNITQTAYLALSGAMFFGTCIILRTQRNTVMMRRAFFTWVTVHATLGLIDLGSKLIGAGDVLFPIRTASYALLTEVEEAGFWRVAGGFAEASSFGGATLSCLAFTFVYWRATDSRPALGLTLLLSGLLLASTSSTAYAGGAVLALILMLSIISSALRGQIAFHDVLLLALGATGLVALISLYLYNESLFDPVSRLIDSTLLDKAASESARERGYWNYRSLKSFLDTGGLGIGLGSSRASNWSIAVVSQLGLIGGVLMGLLVFVLLRGAGRGELAPADRELVALAAGARAAIVGSLIAGSMIGSGVDPGLLFFISLGIIVTCRHRRSQLAAQARRTEPFSGAMRVESFGAGT